MQGGFIVFAPLGQVRRQAKTNPGVELAWRANGDGSGQVQFRQQCEKKTTVAVFTFKEANVGRALIAQLSQFRRGLPSSSAGKPWWPWPRFGVVRVQPCHYSRRRPGSFNQQRNLDLTSRFFIHGISDSSMGYAGPAVPLHHAPRFTLSNIVLDRKRSGSSYPCLIRVQSVALICFQGSGHAPLR